MGGSSVDGAIYRAAGPEAECPTLGGCAAGQAKVTRGCKPPVIWVIHAVDPVWHDGNHCENELLTSCYRSCFALVEKHGIKTVAFPSISTDVYGFPMDRAARIALREVERFLRQYQTVEKAILVYFDVNALEIHKAVLRETCRQPAGFSPE